VIFISATLGHHGFMTSLDSSQDRRENLPYQVFLDAIKEDKDLHFSYLM
jgi:hypothetical protein